MILATGDCHGGFQRFSRKHFPQQRQMNRDDCMIILGDFGGVWDGSSEERKQLDWLNEKPFTTLFVTGNHGKLPEHPVVLVVSGDEQGGDGLLI